MTLAFAMEPMAVWALALSVVSLVVSPAVTMLVLVRLPPDAFAEDRRTRPTSAGGWLLRIAVNLLGWLLVLLGIVMSIPGVPGQGLLTIVMGLLLVDFPGRVRLLRRLLLRPAVRTRVDRLRARFGRPPFVL